MSDKTEVVITDISIPFTSMISIMVKMWLAAIPALLLIGAFFGGIFGIAKFLFG